MNRTELVAALADELDTTKVEARRVIDALFGRDGVIAGTLAAGDRVQITGFGTFERRERKARKGRNPQTGDEIEIGPTATPWFRAGTTLKEAVRE